MQWLCNTTLLLLCKVKNRGITLIAPAQSYTSCKGLRKKNNGIALNKSNHAIKILSSGLLENLSFFLMMAVIFPK